MAVIKIKEGFDVKPAGLYVLQVKAIQEKTAQSGKNIGNQFLSWEDTILEADDPELIGESYFHITPPGCSPKSKHYKLFDCLGFGIPEGAREMNLDTDELVGKEFVAEIGVDKDGDTERNSFKNIWSTEEFKAHLAKTEALKSKLLSTSAAKNTTTVKSVPTVNTVAGNESAKKGSILHAADNKLTDFPA